MGRPKHFYTFLIVVFSLTCFRSKCSHLHHELLGDFLPDHEYGYDFGAYPSYLSPIKGFGFDNSVRIDGRSSYITKGFGKVKVSGKKSISVLTFGAKGDGKIDDTKAFQSAWKEACLSSQDHINLVVPQSKTYLLKPVRFSGPCKSQITMEIAGAVLASDDRSNYDEDRRHWFLFDNVRDLVLQGGGLIDGNGDIWWQNSCKFNKSKPCEEAPTALTFYNCTNLAIKNLRIENAQQIHVSIEQCRNVEAENLVVNTPQQSPNTDGIHVTNTQNIHLRNSVIATGDDCISIVTGSDNVLATNITCGPGHGISIGSLGSGNSAEYVSNVVVNGATLYGTTNGVRIKTWQGGSGSASNITFQNIQMKDVLNPIVIDQNYCDQDVPCKEQSSAVQVKNIMFQNIKGSSAANPAIKLECSKSHPCQELVLQNVNLVGANGSKSEAVCKNAYLKKLGDVSPNCP